MRACEWCDGPIGPDRRDTAKTCSKECGNARRSARSRQYQRDKYVPSAGFDERACARCGLTFRPYRANNTFCSRRCQWSSTTIAKRPRTRPCTKCGADTPTKPGFAVCPDCKVDKRDPSKARDREQRRRLNLYGLTAHQFDAMLALQDQACAICRSSDPGPKGWSIDHCHSTGRVRGLLCHRCNLGLGFFLDDTASLFSAIAYLRRGVDWRTAS